jgi:hypothetical protein
MFTLLLFVACFPALFATCCSEVVEEPFFFNIESVEPLNFDHGVIEFIEENSTHANSTLSYAMVFQTSSPHIKNAKPQSAVRGIGSQVCSRTIFRVEGEIIDDRITATESYTTDYPEGANLNNLFIP